MISLVHLLKWVPKVAIYLAVGPLHFNFSFPESPQHWRGDGQGQEFTVPGLQVWAVTWINSQRYCNRVGSPHLTFGLVRARGCQMLLTRSPFKPHLLALRWGGYWSCGAKSVAGGLDFQPVSRWGLGLTSAQVGDDLVSGAHVTELHQTPLCQAGQNVLTLTDFLQEPDVCSLTHLPIV